MQSWMKLMPWCIVVWIARRHCEVFTLCGCEVVRPFPGVTVAKH
jgi:hypothetical protein